MKSFSLLFFLIATNFLVGPALGETIYKQRRPSELSSELFTYELEVETSVGKMEVEIHAKESNELYVKRVAQILVEDAPPLVEYFGYVPWNKVHFLVDGFVEDRISDRANGAATVHPRPLILLYTSPPVGMEHLVTKGDWVKTLVLHELVHILHIDQTSGFIKFLRYLMGSDGKLGGVVPAWFAEGVATWGETKFTKGGRLSRGLFSFEFHNRVLKANSCKSTVCLDNPGKHPYQGARYWYGSHFLSWVEKRKPGSMACIIKNNSDNLPFFLHWAFRDCVEEDFQVLFDKYITGLEEQLKKNLKKFRNSKRVDGYGHLAIKDEEYLLISDGMQVHDGKIYVSMLDQKHNNYLKVVDLYKKDQNNYRLSDFIENIIPPANGKDVIIKTFREYSSNNPTLWKHFDQQTKKLSKDLAWPEARYLFQLEENDYLGLEYSNSVWEIWERKKGKKEKIFDLPPLTNLFNPQVIVKEGRSFITYRFHDYSQKPSHEYLRIDLKTGNEEVLFQSNESLEVIGSCGLERILSSEGKYYALNIQNGYLSNLPSDFKDLVYIGGDDKSTVVLFKDDPRRIYFKKQNCKEWINQRVGVQIRKEMRSTPALNKDYIEDKSSYPEWDHFLPHRWGLGYSGGDATSGFTLSTTVNDPGFIHTLEGQFKIYTDNDEKGGLVSYQHSNDYFDLFGSYYKEFLTSNTKPTPDSVERTSAGLQKSYYFGALNFIPSFSYSTGSTFDFISSRKYQNFTLGGLFQTENIHFDDFLRGASLGIYLSHNETERRLDYQSLRTKAKLVFHPSYSFDLSVQGTYEKLDKDDLASGVAYAGGYNDLNGFAFHEFYGIQSNDAFGNEVYSGKVETNYLLNEAYNGPSYFPLYIRKIYASLGAGILKSDFIFIDADRRFLIDETVMNVFGGMSTDVDIFYLASVRIDLIMAQLISSKINNNQSQFLVLLKTGL